MADKHRIRLSAAEIKVIHKALDFFEQNSQGEIYDGINWKEESAALLSVSRRFHFLDEDIQKDQMIPQQCARSPRS